MRQASDRRPASDGRRRFLSTSSLCGLAALAAPKGLLAAAGKGGRVTIAFNTANLVAQLTGWRFELSGWMDQHNKTIAATDEAAWRAICKQIAAAGFEAVEVWEAHAAPESLDEAKAKLWRRILDDAGLLPVAYAGGVRRETLQICRAMGIPHIDGGLRDNTPEKATALCREFGIGFNIENHPEKTPQELLGKIGGGNEWLGVCIDMGWLGTQGVDAPGFIRSCGSFVRHTHVKDVKAAGAHDTVLLGEGSVGIAACLQALRDVRYAGSYSWEDEPEDRNPFDSAVRNRQWLEQQLRS